MHASALNLTTFAAEAATTTTTTEKQKKDANAWAMLGFPE